MNALTRMWKSINEDVKKKEKEKKKKRVLVYVKYKW